MNKINSIAELKAERIRLNQKRLRLENEIENDFSELKDSFTPAKLFAEGASKMIVNNNSGIVNGVVSLLTDIVFKNVLLRNSGLITRLVVPFLARNTTNNLVQDNKTKILGWVGDLILKMGNRKNRQHIHDKTTASTDV